MYKEYLNLKKYYTDYVVIVKKGLFYRTFNDDYYIINYISNYKINIFSKYKTVCFPKESLSKIRYRLDRLNINYLIVIGNASIKKDNNDNSYLKIINKLNIDTIN